MSAKLYCKMWLATAEDIQDVVLREKVIQQLEPITDRRQVHGIYGGLYARYVSIVNALGDIFDQTLQVQKRDLVRRMLMAATGRLLELQTELKNIEMSEFIYIDQTLYEEKFVPQQVQLLRPFYYPATRLTEMQDVVNGIRRPATADNVGEEGKKTIQYMLAEAKRLEEANRPPVNPVEEAVKLIKAHEQLRQARCLLTNIRMHPEIYKPQATVEVEKAGYKYFHKPDQIMLIPVKRTVYQSDFMRENKTLNHIVYYESPHKVRPVVTVTELTPVPSWHELVPEPVDIVLAQRSSSLQRMREATEHAERLIRKTDACSKIQRYFRRYRIRKLIRLRHLRRMQHLGIADARRWNFSERERTRIAREANRGKKKAFDEAFVQACTDAKARIVKVHSEWLVEDISDYIRNWFREMYDSAGEFDKYPPALKGGTVLVLRGETMSPVEFGVFVRKRNELAAKSPAERKKIADEEKKKIAAQKAAIKEKRLQAAREKAAEKEQLQKAGIVQWEFNEPPFVSKNFLTLEKISDENERDWRFVDEMANVQQLPYIDWIEIDKHAELHLELQPVVDEMMRVEYELLQMALCQDNKVPYKPAKPPKPKKAKRPKKAIDERFGERLVETVYDEMREAGVIVNYEQTQMDDYIGDINYGAYELRNCYDRDPMHCMGEVKDVLRTWMLGMGPLDTPKPRSICIAGPPGSGKRFLVNALATDMDAIMFNLSAHVVFQFRDNMQEFCNNVMKLAKLMAPSVLYIDGAHIPFIKKMPPELRAYEPKLLAKYLPKMLKQIKPTDKVMLLGTTNEPWNANPSGMKKTFERILLVPGSDHGSTFLTWRTAILNKHGIDRMMDFSALSTLTRYYGTAQMLRAVDNVLNLERRVRLPIQAVTPEELLEALLNGPPPYFPMDPIDMSKYTQWYAKVNKYAATRAAYRAKKDALAAAAAKKQK